MDQRIGILARHHRRMLDVLLAARPLLDGSLRDADLAGMGYLRREMMEAMECYRRFVRQDVGEPAAAAGTAALADAAALRSACADIDAAYDAFRGRWAERDMAEHWSEYRLSAIRMMKQIGDGVRRAGDLPARWAI